MQPRRIGISTLIALSATATTAFAPHFPLSFAAPPALAQTSADWNVDIDIEATLKEQADRLLDQGIQQAQTSQFKAAMESWQQSLAIYRTHLTSFAAMQ